MVNYDLNPEVNKTPPDPRNLLLGQVRRYGRKSNKEGRVQTSLLQQRSSTLKTCEKFSLPTSDADIVEEPIGAKGNWWWEGGGLNGLEAPDPDKKCRMALTRLLHEVRDKKCRCIVVFNLDRLFRSVSIAQELIMFLYRHDCLLYSYEGFENIWTHQGRNAILQNAIASQALSENSRINSPRGVRDNLDNDKLVVSPNVLGFRSAGHRTGQVLHIEEEQALVNRIYRMSDSGKSTLEIADELEREGVKLYASTDGNSPHGHKRTEANRLKIRMGSIRDILRDVRYVGLQKWNGDNYPCPVFLREVQKDGQLVRETVVPYEIWGRVQEKLDTQKRVGNRSVNKRVLAGLVRCGHDGTVLNAQECPCKSGNHYWIIKSTSRPRDGIKKTSGKRYGGDDSHNIDQPIGTCSHGLPSIRVNIIDDYIIDTLGPLISAELSDRYDAERDGVLAARRAQLEQSIHEKNRYRREELPKFAVEKSVSPFLLGQMENNVVKAIASLQKELAEVVRLESTLQGCHKSLYNLRNIDEGLRRDIIRLCFVWIAVFADSSERERKPNYKCDGYTYAPNRVGKLVFLTAWGTYHTAIICRDREPNRKGYVPFTLRPAPVEDTIGGVADFLHSDRFYAGLKNSWEGRVYNWSPSDFAPGYAPGATTVQSIVEEHAKLAA